MSNDTNHPLNRYITRHLESDERLVLLKSWQEVWNLAIEEACKSRDTYKPIEDLKYE